MEDRSANLPSRFGTDWGALWLGLYFTTGLYVFWMAQSGLDGWPLSWSAVLVISLLAGGVFTGGVLWRKSSLPEKKGSEGRVRKQLNSITGRYAYLPAVLFALHIALAGFLTFQSITSQRVPLTDPNFYYAVKVLVILPGAVLLVLSFKD